MENTNENFPQISSAIILRIRFECAVYKTILLIAEYFSVEVLFCTQFMSRKVNSICYIDLQVECTERKIPLQESTMDEPTVKN